MLVIAFGTKLKDGWENFYAQAILVYFMSCFKLPGGLCKHINSIIIFFGGDVNKEEGNQPRCHGK